MTGHRQPLDGYDANNLKPDPGDGGKLLVDRSPCRYQLGTANASYTLPNPNKAGLMLFLEMTSSGGDCVVTAASGVNASGHTTLTFDAVGDVAFLYSVKTSSGYAWKLLSSISVVAS